MIALEKSSLWEPILIRLMVGTVFLSEGIQKFLYPGTLGVGRFSQIGIPFPEITAPFVGIVEIIFGSLLIIGFMTRLACLPLLIDILTAIATTKIPLLLSKGFWPMAHEARTDFCMLLGLLFLLIVGPGKWSIDDRFPTKPAYHLFFPSLLMLIFVIFECFN
ncbi:DoxX family protein [Candidatus Protochlamydia phocaeensis]|uniref:DoxX family protein n=1 Tax=Candidatus Protochlamydia phocaeensis TaxID=1414722 RepID=UPI000A67F666|nr:DoxX family protein [Candidatus Protochlamydia phocaeensis]